jgi:hypothetical protein
LNLRYHRKKRFIRRYWRSGTSAEDCQEPRPAEQWPFSLLRRDIEAITTEVREAYSDALDLAVDDRSPVFDGVIDLDHRTRIYSEVMVSNPAYAGLEERLQRIEEVLPSRNYALRELFREVRQSIPADLAKRLETAFARFERGEYESTISECGMAESILFPMFRELLMGLGVGELRGDIGPAIGRIRKAAEAKRDGEGFSLSKSGRLEMFVLSMFEVLHYLRNLCHHDRAEEMLRGELPGWQIRRRATFGEMPEYARLALCLALQIAVELHELRAHSKPGT